MPQEWQVPGSCRIVCTPVRSTARRYTLRDLSRIEGYVNQDHAWSVILGVTAANAGIDQELCRLAKLLTLLEAPLTFLGRAIAPLAALGIATTLQRVARILHLLGIRLPRRLAVIVEFFALVAAVVAEFDSDEVRSLVEIGDMAGALRDICVGSQTII